MLSVICLFFGAASAIKHIFNEVDLTIHLCASDCTSCVDFEEFEAALGGGSSMSDTVSGWEEQVSGLSDCAEMQKLMSENIAERDPSLEFAFGQCMDQGAGNPFAMKFDCEDRIREEAIIGAAVLAGVLICICMAVCWCCGNCTTQSSVKVQKIHVQHV